MERELLKKIMVLATVLLVQNSIEAQMYVSANSSVFASNEVVFIGQDLALNAATSTFYLRENAQLLQGSTSVGANKGVGSLSVFQKGSTNNFQYNYWCSPVGGTVGTAGNSPFGVTQLKDIDGLITFKEPTMLPLNNYNGTASPLAIAPFWINKLTASSDYSNWIQVGSSSSLNAGEGFTMKGTSGTNGFTVNGVQNNPGSQQRYDFRGKPNDGTISIPVAIAQFTLTGNPYPSAIDLSAFLLAETNCSGIAYFWEQDPSVNSHFIADYKGGYATFAPGDLGSSGVYVPATFYSYDGSGNEGTAGINGATYERRFSPIGQGFLIDGIANGVVQMKNVYRVFVKETPPVASPSKMMSTAKAKSATGFMTAMQAVSGFDYATVSIAPTPQIRFNTLMNNQGVRQLALALIPEATDGVDRAMDALSSGDNVQSDVYFVIDGSEFIINAVNFDIDKKIAIGFRNDKPANYKITVKEMVNFTGANAVYLHDKVKDTYYDIVNNFHELDLPTGENNSQFEITFKSNGNLGVDEAAEENFVIFQNNPTKNVVISNPLLMDLDTFGLYDVTGKLIFVKKDLGVNATYQFSTSGLGDGIYIVKLVTKDTGVVGKKVIIKN